MEYLCQVKQEIVKISKERSKSEFYKNEIKIERHQVPTQCNKNIIQIDSNNEKLSTFLKAK